MQSSIHYNKDTNFYTVYTYSANIKNRHRYHFDATQQVDAFMDILKTSKNLSCQFWHDIHSVGYAKLDFNGSQFRQVVSRYNTLSYCARQRSVYLLLRQAYGILHNAEYMASTDKV
jgi:hypothetical protein